MLDLIVPRLKSFLEALKAEKVEPRKPLSPVFSGWICIANLSEERVQNMIVELKRTVSMAKPVNIKRDGNFLHVWVN